MVPLQSELLSREGNTLLELTYSHQTSQEGLGSSQGGNGPYHSNGSEKNAMKTSFIRFLVKNAIRAYCKALKTQKRQIKDF